MQNLEDGWYAKKEYCDENGNWHTEETDYMSKADAKRICDAWNNTHDVIEGDCSLCYSNDFDLEEHSC